MVAFYLEDISIFTRLFVGSFNDKTFPCYLPIELSTIAKHGDAFDLFRVEAGVTWCLISLDFELLTVVCSLKFKAPHHYEYFLSFLFVFTIGAFTGCTARDSELAVGLKYPRILRTISLCNKRFSRQWHKPIFIIVFIIVVLTAYYAKSADYGFFAGPGEENRVERVTLDRKTNVLARINDVGFVEADSAGRKRMSLLV